MRPMGPPVFDQWELCWRLQDIASFLGQRIYLRGKRYNAIVKENTWNWPSWPTPRVSHCSGGKIMNRNRGCRILLYCRFSANLAS